MMGSLSWNGRRSLGWDLNVVRGNAVDTADMRASCSLAPCYRLFVSLVGPQQSLVAVPDRLPFGSRAQVRVTSGISNDED